MSPDFLNFHSASFPLDHPVCIGQQDVRVWSDLLADVERVSVQLDRQQHRVWALYEPDTYRFVVMLLALLAKDCHVLLPGDNHSGVVAALRDQGAQLAGGFEQAALVFDAAGASVQPRDWRVGGTLAVFTSGSTGLPKRIDKSLPQIDAELTALEALWGSRLEGSAVLSTVSHQHFYGLLFALLWPLCSGRLFGQKAFVDPVHLATFTADHVNLAKVVWVMSPAHLHRLSMNMPWQAVSERVSAVFSSGGPLRYEAATDVATSLGQWPLEVFGSSETGGIAWREQSSENAPWQPFEPVTVCCGDGGELQVKSSYLPEDELFITADSVVFQEDGRFTLGARLDRIVKLEGKRVALQEVEQALCASASISDAAVVALPGKRDQLGAVLQLDREGWERYREQGHHGFFQRLRRELAKCLPAVAVPRRWRVVTVLPRNPQGKLLAQQVRALFEDYRYPEVLKRHREGDVLCLVLAPLAKDNPYLAGHFTSQGVLPGVTQVAWAQHFAEQELGIKPLYRDMRSVKFKSLVFPGVALELRLQYKTEQEMLLFSYRSQGGQHSEGRLIGEGIE